MTRNEMSDILIANGIHPRKYYYPLTNAFNCYHDDYDVLETPIIIDTEKVYATHSSSSTYISSTEAITLRAVSYDGVVGSSFIDITALNYYSYFGKYCKYGSYTTTYYYEITPRQDGTYIYVQ